MEERIAASVASSNLEHLLEHASRRAELSRLALERYRLALSPEEHRALSLWADQFYPFQRDWLLDGSSFGVCNKARQIGMSFATGGIGVLWGAFHGETTTIISKGQRESDTVFEKCQRHVELLQYAGSKLANTTRNNDGEIVFVSGGAIVALPSTAGRSFSGNVLLDEFAYQERADEVWDNAAAVAMLPGFKVRVISTPNGVGNGFYNLWNLATSPERQAEEGTIWSSHEVPIALAVAQGYPVDLRKCWAIAKGDPRLFEQLFNCSFLDSVLQYISSDIIEGAKTSEPWDDDDQGADYYAGLDIGRVVDRTVRVIIRASRGIRRVHSIRSIKRTDAAGLKQMIREDFATYQLKRLCIDSTGLGSFPAEEIKREHSERHDVPHRRPRVECVDFTASSKDELATGLHQALMTKILLLPAEDADLRVAPEQPGMAALLRRELAAIKRIITPSANVRYESPNTREGHGDHAWALALANHACTTPNAMVEALRKRLYGSSVNPG